MKIFNWMGTMYRGDIRFTSPMLFAIGLVTMFMIGGLSGVTHAVVPSDWQQTDTYYIVAHFHYVLFGGAIFGLFGGLYYWFPKVFGRMLNDRLGKLHFWLMFIGFNLTFGPMHWLGLQGMIRRTYTYPESLGLTFWNQVATLGSFLIAMSIVVFIFNFCGPGRSAARSSRSRRPVGRANPRVDDHSHPRSTTSTRSLRCTPWMSSGTGSTTRTSAPAGSCPLRRVPRMSTERVTTAGGTRSTCRARRTGRWSPRSGCR